MMKKIVFLFLCSVFLTSCSKNTDNFNEDYIKMESETIIENDNIFEKDKEVEIILTLYNYKTDIETYVEECNKKNGTDYEVYDDSHYTIKITESERIKYLEDLYGETGKNNFLSAVDETYTGVYKKVEFKEDGKIFVLYANKEAYENSLGVGFGTMLMSAMWSDLCQSYNMIPLEEREFTIQILDNETNELIYEYPEE